MKYLILEPCSETPNAYYKNEIDSEEEVAEKIRSYYGLLDDLKIYEVKELVLALIHKEE